MTRADGRADDELRPVTIECNVLKSAAGSATIRCGDTWVLCAASVEERVPKWMEGKGRGWVTAEYSMLPASTDSRNSREGWKGKWPRGRTQEIGRLVGRALRGATVLERLGEVNIMVDCDVLQADGGTRTASVTGGFVALVLALQKLREAGKIQGPVLRDTVCAVSVGLLKEAGVVLDMPYEEDHRAEVDLNIVSTGRGGLVEVQCTAEGEPFAPDVFSEMVSLGLQGNEQLTALQRRVLEEAGVTVSKHIISSEQSA